MVLAFNALHLPEDVEQVTGRINNLLQSGGLIISTTACVGEKKGLQVTPLPLLGKLGMGPCLKAFRTSELATIINYGAFQILEAEHGSHSPP